MEVDKLFWGLVVEQGKQYKQTPKFNFHVSMAALDLKSADNEPVSVYVQVENGEFILCNLTKSQPQVNLDLIFSEGEKVKFYTAGGKSNVHLTGYSMPEDDLGMLEDEDFSDDESVSDSEMMQKLASVKRKNTETLKLTGKDAKKLKTNDGKAVDAKPQQQKIIDVDPKQLLNKKQDNKAESAKKNAQPPQQNAQQPKKAALKSALEENSDASDDDLSVDEDEESMDLNKLMEDSDDLEDEDLESDDDDDLESDDEEDISKMSAAKNKINKAIMQPQGKPQQQVASGQKKANEKPQQGGKPNFGQGKPQQNKTPQQHQNKTPQHQNNNKSNQNTPFNKSNQKNGPGKHQHTPFHNKNQNSNKKHTPFKHNSEKKPFGSQGKPGKKVFA